MPCPQLIFAGVNQAACTAEAFMPGLMLHAASAHPVLAKSGVCTGSECTIAYQMS